MLGRFCVRRGRKEEMEGEMGSATRGKSRGDKRKRKLLAFPEMGSISTRTPGTMCQEIRTGHRVLSVLKIKTDSLQVALVFSLVHKCFV